MNYQKLSWLSSLVVLGTIASTLPVVAETNQSDTSGGQTYSAPTVSIDSNNGNGIPTDTQYNPNTGEIIGGGINEPIQFDSASGSGSASGFGNGNVNNPNSTPANPTTANNGSQDSTGDTAANPSDRQSGNSVATVECSTKSCLEANGNQNSKVSLNDVAALLDEGLDTSLDNLAEIAKEGQVAAVTNEGPRRIVRRGSGSNNACGCASPATSTNNSPRRIVRKSQGVGCGCVDTVKARKVEYREIQGSQNCRTTT